MKSKLVLTLTAAFVGLAALSAKAAYSDGLSCSDWSFNTPGCSAYIEVTNQATASAAAYDIKQELASCSDWSFNKPGCSAYIVRTNKAAASADVQDSKQQLASCADWSFNTPGCSAYIEKKSTN